MIDVPGGSIGIELERWGVRPVCQRGLDQLLESRSKVWEASVGAGRGRDPFAAGRPLRWVVQSGMLTIQSRHGRAGHRHLRAHRQGARFALPLPLGESSLRKPLPGSPLTSPKASGLVTTKQKVVNRPAAFEQPVDRFELPENRDGRQLPVDLGQVTAEDPDGDVLTYDVGQRPAGVACLPRLHYGAHAHVRATVQRPAWYISSTGGLHSATNSSGCKSFVGPGPSGRANGAGHAQWNRNILCDGHARRWCAGEPARTE